MFAFGSSGSRSGSRCESGELKSMQKNERSDVPSNTLKPHIQAICYARICQDTYIVGTIKDP